MKDTGVKSETAKNIYEGDVGEETTIHDGGLFITDNAAESWGKSSI